MSNISARLKLAMESKQVSAYDLERVTQIPKSSIYRYLRDYTKAIPGDKLSKLATALDVPIDYLLGVNLFMDWDMIYLHRYLFLAAAEDKLGSALFHDLCDLVYCFNPVGAFQISGFTHFIQDTFSIVRYLSSGQWLLELKKEETLSDQDPEILTVFNKLTPENKAKVLELAKMFLAAQ